MPATEAGSGTTSAKDPTARRTPLWLLAAAGVLLVLRVVLSFTEPRPSAPAPAASLPGRPAPGGAALDAVSWREPGAGEMEAMHAGRPVLYDFTAEWCGPCRMMSQDVFTDARFARMLEQRAVPVRVLDRQREAGRNPPAVDALQRQFQVSGFPTLVAYEPRTGKFERLEGYAGAARTRAWLLEKTAAVAGSSAPPPLPSPGGR